MEKAIFAAGCFWGVEASLRAQTGVVDAVSGYTGGHPPAGGRAPTYEQVCGGDTGHAEAVEVTFDPTKTSYEVLVRKFFTIHDATEMNRQGPDVDEQYRSAIFYLNDSQKEIAEKVKAELNPSYFPKTIATAIEPATTFWPAEDYHQRYAEKHPGRVVCHI